MKKHELQNLLVLIQLFEKYYLNRKYESMGKDLIKKVKYIIFMELAKMGEFPERKKNYDSQKINQVQDR